MRDASRVAPADPERGIDTIRRSPPDGGRVELIVRRPREDEREVLEQARIDERDGMVGDYGSPPPDAQITLMNARAIELIAGDRGRWPLAGDQLYVDLDLSAANLAPGARLELGTVLLEVTAEPHTGCGKFARRYGVDALKLVNSAVGRELNLRGINARVVRGGTVRAGDAIRKLR